MKELEETVDIRRLDLTKTQFELVSMATLSFLWSFWGRLDKALMCANRADMHFKNLTEEEHDQLIAMFIEIHKVNADKERADDK